jgi:hypothetical protein
MTQTIEIHGSKPAWLWDGYCCSLDKELRRNYGITCEQYNTLFKAQGGVCAICGEPPGAYKLAVDHNRKTGKIRGLIHMRHNRVITQEVSDYILHPPADEFDFVVPKDRQQYLDKKRAKQRKKQPSTNGNKKIESAGVETYEEAIQQLLGE